MDTYKKYDELQENIWTNEYTIIGRMVRKNLVIDSYMVDVKKYQDLVCFSTCNYIVNIN